MSNAKDALKIALVLVGLVSLCTACTPQQAAAPAETETSADSALPAQAPASTSTTTEPPVAVNKPAPLPVEQPPTPRFVEVTIPAGVEIEIELLDELSSGVSKVGDPVRGRLSKDLVSDGRLVASAGAEVEGAVTQVVPLKKFGGQPSLTVAFQTLVTDDGSKVPVVAEHTELGKKQAGRDAAKIGGGALAGAILGHQVDDDKGSEIGAVVGGAVGTVVAAKTGKEIELHTGALIVVALDQETRVRLPS